MSAYTDAVLADSPIAYWRLDTTVGTESDLGSGGHTLTYNGAVSRGVTGLIASDPDLAASFSTASTFCSTPNVADLRFTTGPWAVEAWIHPTSLDTYRRYVTCAAAGGFGYTIGIVVDELILSIPGITDIQTTALNLTAQKYHVVVQFRADADVDFYLNGSLAETVVNASVPASNTTGDLRISTSAAGAEEFIGTIDEVALYSAGISAARILAHYNASFPGASVQNMDKSLFPKAILRAPVPVRW